MIGSSRLDCFQNMEVSNGWILRKRFRQVLLVGLILFRVIKTNHYDYDGEIYDSQGRYRRWIVTFAER